MVEIALFASTFVVVFFLGVQSLNVTGGHYLAAFVTSFLISGANLVLFKLVPGDTTALQLAAYFAGGPFGIVCAMWVHGRTIGRKRRTGSVPPPRRNPPPPGPHNSARWLDVEQRKSSNINCGADRP